MNLLQRRNHYNQDEPFLDKTVLVLTQAFVKNEVSNFRTCVFEKFAVNVQQKDAYVFFDLLFICPLED